MSVYALEAHARNTKNKNDKPNRISSLRPSLDDWFQNKNEKARVHVSCFCNKPILEEGEGIVHLFQAHDRIYRLSPFAISVYKISESRQSRTRTASIIEGQIFSQERTPLFV